MNTQDNKKKLMIVEDDFFIRDLYEIQAKNAGYEVMSVEDGEQAYSKVKDFKPDIILLDIMLPNMDGITFLKKIKTDDQLRGIICIIITNLEDSNQKQEALQLGAADYLLKIENTPKMVIDRLKDYI